MIDKSAGFQFCSAASEYLSSQWRGRGDRATAITGPNLCPILLCCPTTPLCYFWAACVSTGVTSRCLTHSHTQSHKSKEKATCTVPCQWMTHWEHFFKTSPPNHKMHKQWAKGNSWSCIDAIKFVVANSHRPTSKHLINCDTFLTPHL